MKTGALLLLSLFAFSAFAALSPQLVEFGEGPAQWIMTGEEKKEWRKLASDDEATKFIDAFWARRGGVAYKYEFDSRVQFADERFSEKRKRGALTDRGRVYIVLGPPTSMGGQVAQSNVQRGVAVGGDIGASRQQAARESWIWERDDARKFDMARVEVVFFEDPNTHKVQRDPRRADFSLASAVAIRKSLEARPAPPAPTPAQAVAPVQEAAPAPVAAAPVAAVEAARLVASNTPGVSRLTLLKGGALDPRAASDPFPAKSETSFSGAREIPFALQFCAAKAEMPKLTYMLLIAGPLDGAAKEQRTRQKAAKLEHLNAKPGCYALQGTVPVSQLTPGRYKVSVLLDEPATSETWSAKADFRLE